MKLLDLLKLSVSNLKRRKLRTVLTVLGVLIGTASVVTMMSLGIGLNELNREDLEKYGSLKTIEARVPYNMQNDNTGKNEPVYIKDETIEKLKRLPHVKGVSPILRTEVFIMQGSYVLYTQIVGVDDTYMKDIELGSGHLPTDKKKLEFLYGNTVIRYFSNPKNRNYDPYNQDSEPPDIDYYKSMFVIFDTETYQKAKQGGENAPKPPKKYIIPTAGVVKGSDNFRDPDSYNPYNDSIYCNIDALKVMLKKVYKNKAIPNQPTTKKGKPLKFLVYDSALVYVDEMDNVMDVQAQIKDMGFDADSQMQWLEQTKSSTNMIQMVLGGIGAVSLFVASIGIANTMMMSIYERTKEIGIMKVLGCDMNRIRDIFLIESGAIGFMGGLTGVILSFIISKLINVLGVAVAVVGVEGDMSRIPLWLVGSAIIFAIIIGMLAGLFPALRAMKLSPLTALRND